MLTSAEIEEALLVGHERRDFEIKGPGSSTDRDFLANVVREVLGLGNIRDCGHVVIGIDGRRQTEMLPGLAADELATWLASMIYRVGSPCILNPLSGLRWLKSRSLPRLRLL
ncbi:MAG: hypothetical protein WAO09_10305 [Candidatus Dormiibacterota bacterium]